MNQFKDLIKAAFSIGFGFTIGKFAADMFITLISSIGVTTLKLLAKEGSEIAKNICKESDIEIESTNKESEIKIWFHYN